MTPRTRIIVATAIILGIIIAMQISHKATKNSLASGRGPQTVDDQWLDEDGNILRGEYIYDDENSSFSQPRNYNWSDMVHHLSPMREVFARHNATVVEEFFKRNHSAAKQQGALYPLIV